jgi:phytoene dehydrogenase-like protein
MRPRFSYDAVVVGAGPNGLAAAIRLAQRGLAVLVLEASDSVGGGARSAELTLPGFVHDVCSAVHPLCLGSPFLRTLPLERFGLKWLNPEVALAHPLDQGEAVILRRSLPATASLLGADGSAYARLMEPLAAGWDKLAQELFRPLLHWPRAPLLLARFGLAGVQSATRVARHAFREEPARALWAGLAAHSGLRLEAAASAAFALVLGSAAHAVGWPLPRGGAGQVGEALATQLRALGGEIRTRSRVDCLEALPLSRVVLLDLTPRQVLRLAGGKLPASYRARLERFRYGCGVFKVDYALRAPIPWRATECALAPTVHLGGTLAEIASAERAVAAGRVPEKPFVILVQASLFDDTRAPAGHHTAWAYCHAPPGSTCDLTDALERQIERFAPGFRECILARHTMHAVDLERHNPNLVGGDINGGAADLRQLAARPVFGPRPYRTPVPGLYLCSASTPPGGGVHGMCGFHAAETAWRDWFA